ncbi:hypothetical protein [Actinomadura sp. NBRC 104412]|uniref:hypothetical protein n=1 Tax=Actinomadura sp. NBRC 104412 TaxID=3032203 RepID=UPI00255710DD|nr:hypothetical protein [Actinomadura sp. NBRC 104412]
MIRTNRERIRLDLLSYGEDHLAGRAAGITDDQLRRIGERGLQLVLSDAQGKLYLAIAMAAVEVLEGAPRPLARKRRKLKGVWDQHHH